MGSSKSAAQSRLRKGYNGILPELRQVVAFPLGAFGIREGSFCAAGWNAEMKCAFVEDVPVEINF